MKNYQRFLSSFITLFKVNVVLNVVAVGFSCWCQRCFHWHFSWCGFCSYSHLGLRRLVTPFDVAIFKCCCGSFGCGSFAVDVLWLLLLLLLLMLLLICCCCYECYCCCYQCSRCCFFFLLLLSLFSMIFVVFINVIRDLPPSLHRRNQSRSF